MLAGLSGRAKHLLGAPMRAPASRLRATRPSSSGPQASPVPAVPRPTTTTAADTHREINLTCVGIVATLIASLLSIATVALRVFGYRAAVTWPHLLTGLVFLLIVAYLIYGSLVYQLTRLAYLRRRLFHRRASDDELLRLYRMARAPSVTVLVPAYKEDVQVVRKTLLSAALQGYPKRRIVLLIDDPPQPTSPHDLAQELRRLSRLHRDIGAWFQTQAARHPIADHVDGLFVDLIYRGQARRFFRWSKELDQWPAVRHLDEEDLVASYRWLVSLFDVSVSTFERKR